MSATEQFVTTLESWGYEVERSHGLVTFPLTVAAGTLAGQTVRAGVHENELECWPMAPPHWIHLPKAALVSIVNGLATNRQRSPIAGWSGYSWVFPNWRGTGQPIRALLAHIQDLLGHADA